MADDGPLHRVGVALEVVDALGDQLVPTDHPVGGVIVLRTGHEHDVAEVGQLAANLLEALHELEILEDRDGGLAVVGDVLDLVGGQCRVDGYRGRPGMDRGEVGDDVLGAVSGHDGDELPVTHPQRLQTGGGLMHDVPVRRPRHALPVAILPVDRGLIGVRVCVPVERVHDGLSLDDGIDLGSFGEHSSIVDHMNLRTGQELTPETPSLPISPPD